MLQRDITRCIQAYQNVFLLIFPMVSLGKVFPWKYYWNENGALEDTSGMTDAVCSSGNIVVTAGDLLHWRPTGVHNQGWMN